MENDTEIVFHLFHIKEWAAERVALVLASSRDRTRFSRNLYNKNVNMTVILSKRQLSFSKNQLQIENSRFVKTCDEYVHGSE